MLPRELFPVRLFSSSALRDELELFFFCRDDEAPAWLPVSLRPLNAERHILDDVQMAFSRKSESNAIMRSSALTFVFYDGIVRIVSDVVVWDEYGLVLYQGLCRVTIR
jgi:hypothetical protein